MADRSAAVQNAYPLPSGYSTRSLKGAGGAHVTANLFLITAAAREVTLTHGSPAKLSHHARHAIAITLPNGVQELKTSSQGLKEDAA
jgi:hypothetical protein